MASTLSKKKVAAYNKTKTTPKIPKKITPFIDRMTVGVNYEPNDNSASIHANIWNQVKDTAVFAQAKPGGSYNRAWRIKLNSAVQIKHFPILRYRYTEGYAARLSLTFSPHDLGPKGLEELHATLTSIVPQGWGLFVEDGQVTMLEVSVDLPGIPIGSCHPLMQQTTVVKSWSSGGKLETLLFGKKDGNQTRIYDRAQKRKSKKKAWRQGDITRVERVLRNQNLPLNQLPELPNPFSGMKFIDFRSTRPQGARLVDRRRHAFPGRFRSTRPQGARPTPRRRRPRRPGFDPRARRGRDPSGASDRRSLHRFRSTRPQGARRIALAIADRALAVSIHAPAGGATSEPDGHFSRLAVSIHAPAGGATRLTAVAETSAGFDPRARRGRDRMFRRTVFE